MERLDFSLPDFTRLSWVSDLAREVWEPRLRRISNAWLEMEWRTVAAGVRPCGITMASPEELVAQAGRWAEHGLSALPLEIQGVSNYSYSSTPVGTELGKPFVFRLVLGTPGHVARFRRAWEASQQEEIGRLLGYPRCCYEFFRQVWVEQGMVDTTWPMAAATPAAESGERTLDLSGPPEANILWRWMGVRAVSHLPCRCDCEASVELGKRYIAVGEEAGYAAEMGWLLEILSWPVEWSALHGIAEIRTPVLKVSTRTDATPHKYVVQRQGDAYPEEGARGLHFPFQPPRSARLTRSRAFQRGLDNPIPVLEERPPWYAADNGFDSRFAMEEAHQPIVELARRTLSGRGGNVLDLGCGNGALLEKICRAVPGAVPFGIDAEPGRIEHARALHPQAAGNFVAGDLFASDALWPEERRYALALLMPGRLLEAGPEQADALCKRLRACCDQVLVYAYGDWLTRYGDLAGLAREAGLALRDTDRAVKASLLVQEDGPETSSNGERRQP